MHDQITYLASKGHKDATIVLHDRIQIKIFIGNEYVGSGITLPDTCKINYSNMGLIYANMFLFCLLGFTSHSRIFHLYGEVVIIKYFYPYSALSNESSLACHTYCDTGIRS